MVYRSEENDSSFLSFVKEFIKENGYNSRSDFLIKIFKNEKYGIYPVLDIDLSKFNLYDLEEILDGILFRIKLIENEPVELVQEKILFLTKLISYVYSF